MSKELGDKLKQYRSIKGLTLREVEKETKISNGYINQLEKGNIQKPSPHILYKLAEFYKASYNNFMKLAGYIVQKSDNKAHKKLEGIAYSLLNDLTQEEEKELLRYLEYLRMKKRETL